MSDHPQGTSVHEAWTPEGEQAAPRAAASPPAVGEGAVGEDAVIAACSSVYDPEIPVNIYELGLIYAIEIEDDGRVRIEMTLTAPGCPSAQELPEQVREAVLGVPGVSMCDVDVVWDPPWTPERMSDEARLAVNMF
ncbi:MAG: SUF system Fe-S cluster assembly protein [Acetobacteraceae bacterium]|jgi:FeS assembly SUF system protein|nr:SUF system Fe-S cluster assembly protein [Acetobacteraceae bacterium]